MKKLIILGSVAVLLPMVSFAAYVGAGDSVTAPVATESSQNSYLVGGTVNVANQTPGDLVTAGGTIVISGNVEKDILTVGGNVSIIGGTVEDLRVAGGNIIIGKKINGEAMIAGGQVTITSDTQISGDSYIVGGTLVFAGTENRNLTLLGGAIRIDGTVNGNLNIKSSEKVIFGSSAVVKGTIKYSAPNEAVIESGAKLTNTPVFTTIADSRKNSGAAAKGFMAFFGIVFFLKLLGALVAAYILWYLFRRDTVTAIEEIHAHFWKVLLRGFATLILIPIAGIILLITTIGWIPGVVLLATYGALLAIASPLAFLVAASILMKLFKKNHVNLTWYQIILGAIVLRFVVLIPIVGWIVCAVIYLAALGATLGVIKNKFSA